MNMFNLTEEEQNLVRELEKLNEPVLTPAEKALVRELEKLDSKAKKGPWYPQGSRSKDKAVYRVGPNEEALIIALRNNVGVLLNIIRRLEK